MADDRESFYDREIAPVLLDLAKKCEGEGLSLVAMVEWQPGETGSTMSVREEAEIGLRMSLWAIQAKGNADSLIMAMQRHGREHGHNSACLAMLDRS